MPSLSGGVTGQALPSPRLGLREAGPSLSEGLVESDIFYEYDILYKSEHGTQL